VLKLRRSALGFAMAGLSGFWLATGVSLGVVVVAVPGPSVAAFVAVALFLALGVFLPWLFVVRIVDGRFQAGCRWKLRTNVPVKDIATVTLGRSTASAYNVETNAMLLRLVDGTEEFVWESCYCSQRRLREWAATIAQNGEGIEVVEGPIDPHR
jgi:hypothetical protein